ncbi:hypothetical protein Q1695_002799 [Nippostrongylus brasiliensis]|nr:hypothetical protein Q1695_002799 [Nippostrongylus brasiliensis]
MANPSSFVLKHDSIESLNEASELPKDMVVRLKSFSSEKMFASIEKMIQEARNARGDIEKQYLLYYRCAQLSKLIYKQNDFASFKNDRLAIFGLRFKEALDEADKLKTILNKKYEEKMLRAQQPPSHNISVVKAKEEELPSKEDTRSSPSILISPKELVRMVEHAQPKKTAVIVDFRRDKSELINYRNEHVITVVSVPYDLIVHGLIFTSLRNQLEVGQRPLLHRIGSCDLVVLMSDTSVELKNGMPVRGSVAHVLYMALYEYNHEHRPKSRPLFMDGGFDNWRDQYPVYTRTDGTLKRSEPKDQLDHMVNNYKKACLMLDYPDISPSFPSVHQPRGAVTRDVVGQNLPNHLPSQVPNAVFKRGSNGDEAVPNRVETTFSAHDSAVSTSTASDTTRAVPRNNVAPFPAGSSVSVTSSTTINGAPKMSAGVEPSVQKTTVMPPEAAPSSQHSRPSPFETARRDATTNGHPVASGYHPSVSVPPPSSTGARLPMVDRSNKPGQHSEPAVVAQHRVEANYNVPTSRRRVSASVRLFSCHETIIDISFNATPSQTRLPLPDRSLKPVLISIDQEQQLLDIYNSMCDSTEGSSNRRGSPRPGYTGLYNMGNTCFMNATLQALFHTPLMLSIFSKENFMSRVNPHNKMGTGGVISAVFSAMMDVIWSGQYTAIKPQRFLRLFASQVNSCLADGHQHDASEFQLFLLDALHEDTNQVTKRVPFEQNYKGGAEIMNDASDYEKKSRLFSCSPVNKIFNLQTVSELSCMSCGEQSATFEECSLITVELPVHASRTSLHQCLSSHFSQTTLDGDSRWNCPRCRAPKRASRLTKLWSLPPVVVVHLKRFSMENGDYAKNTMPVDFDPGRLDLSDYLHENSPESAGPYRLYAITNHCGRLNSGHYTALVCHGTTGEWLRFDDESVSSSSTSGINTSEAYMLYYKRT